MRKGSVACAKARRTGEDHGLPPSVAHGPDAVAALRFSARKILAAVGLRSPGESGDEDLLARRSGCAHRRIRQCADAAGVQPGRSAAAPTLGAVSIAILPDGVASVSALAPAKICKAMGLVFADLRNQAGRRAGLFST